MISLQDIGFRHILSGISSEFQPGRMTMILGPNGAGKSTLVRIAAGLLTPSGGVVRYDGADIAGLGLAALARRRAVLSQHVDSAIALPVEQVVAMGRLCHGDAEAGSISRLAMERVGIDGRRLQSVATLSGGERQMVHMARILAQIWQQDDAVLFLDEPITHLDLRHQLHVLAIARDLAQRGVTVVAVLHDLNLALSHGDRFLLMQQGRLLHQTDRVSAAMIEEVFEVRVREAPCWQFISPESA